VRHIHVVRYTRCHDTEELTPGCLLRLCTLTSISARERPGNSQYSHLANAGTGTTISRSLAAVGALPSTFLRDRRSRGHLTRRRRTTTTLVLQNMPRYYCSTPHNARAGMYLKVLSPFNCMSLQLSPDTVSLGWRLVYRQPYYHEASPAVNARLIYSCCRLVNEAAINEYVTRHVGAI
jgi:hypothetical protein